MREWVRNIYFLSTNQFSYSKMLEASNNMAPKREDNEIVTQLCIINQQMDWMANKFEDRFERQCVNDHGEVQNRPSKEN